MPEDNAAIPSNSFSQAPVLPNVPVPSDQAASTNPMSPADPMPPTNPAPTNTPQPTPNPAPDNVVVDPSTEPASPETASKPTSDGSIYVEVTNKINEAHNVLIALSSDPSVDEMATAIGLSLFLSKLGKRATAIYSGSTPNALQFLKPEETFEPTADTLQDFVIALNKEKADHLRYKLDGEYVKVYITPYKSRISEEDLDFSYGDYNVDLVLALDVANGIDLDSALREHGRIMHDAVIINITTGKPGKFGEIEWSDKSASSVSEMIAKLLYSINTDVKVEKEEATAFLTGIVAATNRFSSASTTSDTMNVASKLMASGANQQLVSKNITPDIENELFSATMDKMSEKPDNDPTKLDIQHEGEENVDESKEVGTTVTEKTHTLLDDLKAAEESLAQAGAETMPEADKTALKIDSNKKDSSDQSSTASATDKTEESSSEEKTDSESEAKSDSKSDSESDSQSESESKTESKSEPELGSEPVEKSEPEPAEEPMKDNSAPEPTTPILPSPFDAPSEETKESASESIAPETSTSDTTSADINDIPKPEKVVKPSNDFSSDPLNEEDSNKYGQMLEDALNSIDGDTNPAAISTPSVPDAPEINGVPEMNYMPMPGEEVLPPPPTPPIDISNSTMPNPTLPEPSLPTDPITPATPVTEPEPTPLGTQPAMQDQVYHPQAADPSAFKIPGM